MIYFLSIKTLFTLCSVARLGFASGIVVDIQPSRLRMKLLSIGACLLPSGKTVPSSEKNRHKIANAAPMDRSIPLSQAINMSLVCLDSGTVRNTSSTKFVIAGRAVRRFRLPIL